jgi:hypothetical protein
MGLNKERLDAQRVRATVDYQQALIEERNRAVAFVNHWLMRNYDESFTGRQFHEILVHQFPALFTPVLLPL